MHCTKKCLILECFLIHIFPYSDWSKYRKYKLKNALTSYTFHSTKTKVFFSKISFINLTNSCLSADMFSYLLQKSPIEIFLCSDTIPRLNIHETLVKSPAVTDWVYELSKRIWWWDKIHYIIAYILQIVLIFLVSGMVSTKRSPIHKQKSGFKLQVWFKYV